METLFYLGAEAKSFGGESLRVRVVLRETERPGVLGRVVGSKRSRAVGPWHWGEMLSFTALWYVLGFFSS